MSIKCFKRLFISLLFIVGSSSAYAVEACGPNAVDPDMDGWGWENGRSCRITKTEPPKSKYCSSADADPDGDGWGWENGASCKVGSNPNPEGPGTDYETAGNVQLNNSITGAFNGTGVHYYTFEVADNTAIKLDTNLLSSGSIEAEVRTRTTEYLSTFFTSNNTACLESGTYFLVVDRSYVDTVADINYSATVRTTDTNCVSPIRIYGRNAGDLTIMSNDGSVFTYGYDGQNNSVALSKLGDFGIKLWTTNVSDVDDIIVLANDSILVAGFEVLTLLDSQGRKLWTTQLEDVFSSQLVVGNQAIVFQNEGAIIAISIADGVERWRHGLEQYEYSQVQKMSVRDDGSVIVLMTDQVLFFNE